ncbi:MULTISPECIES: F0F1 ATP synthase subunit B family protein [Desulfococcus]|jgi:F-type H+-transporting ATPase subunit b|uniref:ATP synthase subunit b n=1 Tax=Desulfococcus multivorans DSM 2059 TaxID=1121405 RepID=S7VBX0_DESML|nr:ATP synthase F0 subunit B [Desulfococcus multivorans]AOY57354.1 AtpF2: ATP synthase, subunit beta (ATP synthase F0 sector subunit beta) [Desulfococcus multivorans]AQU99801.1 hypothetical protein B2D07_02765 [Desulfococcus multivorans]EPR41983.1 ATP synthase subunit b [Desulfococcus multivorans DSM 2059]MDX9819907.1 ATP synthase F0 subunit B [Desulfococcus multivorans]SKA10683.1 F-type H+-transporting ATPase subunit b [Desulfococcus multivorans DSM 2059]
MKNKWKFLSLWIVVLAGTAACLHLFGGDAFAEEGNGNWRKTYDMVMLWVNFGILSFVVVKFGKKPLMGFLRMRRDEIAAEIKDLENEKALVTEKINEARKAMVASDVRFAELKETIVRMGEKRRQDLIADAERESEFMMSLAEQKVGGYILAAKKTFKDRLVDAAINLAMTRLPDHMTEADRQDMFESYVSSIERKIG